MIKEKRFPKHYMIIIGLILFGFFLRVFNLTFQPLWSDEIDVLNFSSEPINLIVNNIGRPGHNGSLYYLIVHFWLSAIGKSTFSLRYLSVLFGMITLSTAWGLGRLWLGKWGGIWLCLLMTISPYLIWYSQDGKMYSLFLAISMFSVLVLFKATIEEKWIYWFFFVLLTWVGWYIHILYILMAPVHFIAWMVYKKKNLSQSLLLLPLVLIFLYQPFLAWQIPTWMSSFTTGHKYYGFLEILRTQFYAYAIGFPSRTQLISGLAHIFLFIFGMAKIRGLPGHGLVLVSYFTIPMISIYLISLGMPIYTDRYLIPIATSFYGLCAYGLVQLQKKNMIISGVVLLALILNLSTIYTQAFTLFKSAP